LNSFNKLNTVLALFEHPEGGKGMEQGAKGEGERDTERDDASTKDREKNRDLLTGDSGSSYENNRRSGNTYSHAPVPTTKTGNVVADSLGSIFV
jgi:hypothetical protein